MNALTERSSRVVSAVKLHRGASRRKSGTFLVEGVNAVTEALAAGLVEELFVAESAVDRYRETIDAAAVAGVHADLVTERAAERLGETATQPGLVAVARLIDVPLEQAVRPGAGLVAVLVEIADPGNAGTIVRTADAAGAVAVILVGDTVDPHNGKCVRSSAGSLFHLPIARTADFDEAAAVLRERGLSLLATTIDGELELDPSRPRFGLPDTPVAWLFGNEAHGLAPEIAAAADHRVHIPIRGRAESLNVAAAAAVCLYSGAGVVG